MAADRRCGGAPLGVAGILADSAVPHPRGSRLPQDRRHSGRSLSAAASARRALAAGAMLLASPAFAGAPLEPNGARGPSVGIGSPVAIPVPMALAAHLERGEAGTRLSFDLSVALAANAYVLEGPDRIIVDLPEVNFQIDPAVGRLRGEAGGLVRSFRFGLFAPGRSRIVIDLAAPASLLKVSTESIAGGDPSRLTIELVRSDRAAFHKVAAAAAAVLPAADAAPARPASTPDTTGALPRPVIVIDPGHGGIDPGASGLGGVVEKNVVFDFATVLADKLRATGRYAVVMTRDGDTFVSLGDRVRIARDANAALFVSVHADTLSVSGAVTGATVYTASDRASDAEAARVAELENRADAVAGIEAAPMPSGVNDILFDLTRRETRTYAHMFQRTLVGYWEKIARLNKNPERAAGFKVLQAPDVPSVLLELGYLSSDRDVKALTSPDWRNGATGSVIAAIDSFFAPRKAVDTPRAPSADPPTVASAPRTDGPAASAN